MSLLGLLRGQEARTVSEYDIPWENGGSTSRGVTPRTAMNQSANWACQTLIADAIATLPVDHNERRDGLRVEVARPAPWINTPNPYQTRVQYETQRVLSLLGWGNAYSLLLRVNGEIRERYVLNPASVDVRMISGSLTYTINGAPVPSESIQHIPGYVLPGEVKGLSVVECAARSLGVSFAAEEYGENFFEHGAVAGGALTVPQMPAEVSDDVVERLGAQFAKKYGGVKNAHKPIVLTGGTTWDQTTVDPKAAQFLETREFQTAEIARWYRVAPHLIGEVQKSTSWGTGIEQQTLGFAKFTLMPWIIRLEEADSLLLAPREFVRYNLAALVRADIKTRYEVHDIAIRSGMTTPNLANALEDQPPVIGGDAVRLPLNTTLITDDGAMNPTIANPIGVLVRAGYDPASVLEAFGLPPIEHTGLVPITVGIDPEDDPKNQVVPNGSQDPQ